MRQLKRVGLLVWIGISASLIAVGTMTVLNWTVSDWPIGPLSSAQSTRGLSTVAMLVALFHVGVMLINMSPGKRQVSRANSCGAEHTAVDAHARD